MAQALKVEQGAPPLDTSGRYRWIVCALLFFATTINYMDRQILSLLKPILDNQMGWTKEQFGAINSAFQGAYAVGGLAFGWLVDRIGSKIGYSISITGWSLAALGHALVSSIGGFFVARACLGITEAGNFPTSIKTVALWFPKKERAFATSLFNSGANVGPIIAPIIFPWIALTWGWQAAFISASQRDLFGCSFGFRFTTCQSGRVGSAVMSWRLSKAIETNHTLRVRGKVAG
jgi:ACS family hexuronate transporter-like MFS transporter